MIAGAMVRPRKWDNVLDLFEDNEYSAIWGEYDGNQRRCLGVRWKGNRNDPHDIGYPRQGKHPLWYVEPEFLTGQILQTLLVIATQRYDHDHRYTKNLKKALREFWSA